MPGLRAQQRIHRRGVPDKITYCFPVASKRASKFAPQRAGHDAHIGGKTGVEGQRQFGAASGSREFHLRHHASACTPESVRWNCAGG